MTLCNQAKIKMNHVWMNIWNHNAVWLAAIWAMIQTGPSQFLPNSFKIRWCHIWSARIRYSNEERKWTRIRTMPVKELLNWYLTPKWQWRSNSWNFILLNLSCVFCVYQWKKVRYLIVNRIIPFVAFHFILWMQELNYFYSIKLFSLNNCSEVQFEIVM